MARKKRKWRHEPATTPVGCKLIQAADDMPKDTTGSLTILSMIRDTTIRFQRLKAIGVNIKGLDCGL